MLEDHLIAISSYQRHSKGEEGGEILFFETLKRFTRIPWKELMYPLCESKVLMMIKGE